MNKRKILTFITALTMSLTSLSFTPNYVVAEGIDSPAALSDDSVITDTSLIREMFNEFIKEKGLNITCASPDKYPEYPDTVVIEFDMNEEDYIQLLNFASENNIDRNSFTYMAFSNGVLMTTTMYDPTVTTTKTSAAHRDVTKPAAPDGTTSTAVWSGTTTTATTTSTTTTTVIYDYIPKIEFDRSPMKVGETREGRFYHPETLKAENGSVRSASDAVSIDYTKGSDTFKITALKEGRASISINAKGCAFTGFLDIEILPDDGSVKTTAPVATTNITTTTIVDIDYMTKVEYDKSPMKVGEVRRIKFGHPNNETTGGSVYSSSDLIEIDYTKGNNYFDVKALSEGEADISVHARGCAFDPTVTIKVVSADPQTTTDVNEVWMWGTGVDHFDSIKTLPTKTIYNEGEDLDLSGLVVNAYHSATRHSNKGNFETVRTDYVWEIEEIDPEYITIRDFMANTYTADVFSTLKGGNAYIVNIGKNSAVYDMKVAGEQYTKDMYDTTPDFSFRVYINSPDSTSKFIKIDNAEVESFGYGTTSHGFKLKGMDAFSIDMDAHMYAGYSIEGGIRKGDTVSGILNINTANNYIYFGDLDVVKYGGEKGDANADGSLDMADVVMIMQALANPNKYGLDGIDGNRITKRGNGLGDMDGNGLTVGDAQAIQMKLLGLGNNSDPLTPTAQPVGVKTTDEAIKLINNYDLNDYDAAYRDSMKEMFESFKNDGYIYCFADAAGEDRIKPDSGIALMPYMRYEDRGVLYHVTYKGEKYQIYYYLRDSRYAEQSFDKYIANRLGFNMTKVNDDKYYILDNSKTGQSDISAFFAIDGENYCKVRGFGTEAELMEFVNSLNCVKIPINNKLTTDDTEKYPFEAQYIRIYGTGNYNREPVIEMFNSEEELLSRYNPNSQHEKYDEKWFSDHKLIMITVEEPSGSIRHKVTELTSDYVAIDRITPEVMTCDLAIWHIYIELDKDAVINDDFRAEITETKSFDA